MTTAPALCGVSPEAWRALALDVRIRLAASCYLGWRYRTGNKPSVAYESPSVPANLVGPSRYGVDCSTLAASILTAVYPAARWDLAAYGDLQVFADRLPHHPDSPIQAVERLGIGRRTDVFVAGQWHLCQGWRSLGAVPRGHAFLVREVAGSLLVLESSSVEGIGPRWKTTTAEGLRADYPAGLFVARLL